MKNKHSVKFNRANPYLNKRRADEELNKKIINDRRAGSCRI